MRGTITDDDYVYAETNKVAPLPDQPQPTNLSTTRSQLIPNAMGNENKAKLVPNRIIQERKDIRTPQQAGLSVMEQFIHALQQLDRNTKLG